MSGPRTDTLPHQLFASLGFRFVHRFLWTVLAACGLFVAATVGLSWWLEGDVTVRAEGVIRPRVRRVVKAQVEGVVERVAVRAGTRVVPGDILAVLAPRDVRARLRQVELELAQSTARQELLRTRQAQQERVLKATVAARRVEVAQAALSLEQVRREQRLASERALPGWRRLPLEELIPVRRARVALQQAEARLRLAERQREAGLARAREMALEEGDWRRLDDERRTLWRRLEGAVVRAPVRGVVLTADLGLRQGDLVRVGEPLMEIAEDDAWKARVMIGQIDRAKVKSGQRARIFVNAYPHLEYGTVEGTVAEVAEQVAPGLDVYPADVDLVPAGLDLTDGMAVQARVAVDGGRLLELVWRRLLHELGGIGLPALRPSEATPRVGHRTDAAS